MPVLAERKLTPYQGLLHAIWTDERLSAVCATMHNTDHIRENTDAARRFEPLKEAEIRPAPRRDPRPRPDALRRLRRPLLGRRGHAGRAGQPDAVPDLSRAPRASAPRPAGCYAELPPEARDWSGADLEAARAACPNRLDFARLLPEVERRLA